MSGKSQVNVANVHFHKTKVLEELINCVSLYQTIFPLVWDLLIDENQFKPFYQIKYYSHSNKHKLYFKSRYSVCIFRTWMFQCCKCW